MKCLSKNTFQMETEKNKKERNFTRREILDAMFGKHAGRKLWLPFSLFAWRAKIKTK